MCRAGISSRARNLIVFLRTITSTAGLSKSKRKREAFPLLRSVIVITLILRERKIRTLQAPLTLSMGTIKKENRVAQIFQYIRFLEGKLDVNKEQDSYLYTV